MLFSCVEEPEDCGQEANNWIKTVSECIGLYLIKNLRKKYESRKMTRTAMERNLVRANLVSGINMLNVVVYFLRLYGEKCNVVSFMVIFVGLVNQWKPSLLSEKMSLIV